ARLVIFELALGVEQLLDTGVAVVGVGRREVTEHLAPVDALPDERVRVRTVEPVPRQFLRQEAHDPREPQELRPLGAIAERGGRPELAATDAELVLEEPLSVDELAQQRLAGRDVAVRLDPAPTDGHELPALHACPNALPKVAVTLLDPRVLLGLRAREAVLGVLVHVPRLTAERADRLAIGLRERPQPRRVDVRVADRRDLVCARPVVVLVERLEDRGILLVAEPVQLGAQVAGPAWLERIRRLELAEELEVVEEPPRVLVETREPARH